MKIAVLGAGRVGSTIGRLWHAAGHDVTFAARHVTRPPTWCSWPSRAAL
jgi:predicted dinucleotide-binding enzyme